MLFAVLACHQLELDELDNFLSFVALSNLTQSSAEMSINLVLTLKRINLLKMTEMRM